MMKTQDTPTARHLLIHGVVQGVGFRASTVVQARRLGLRGWVRNRRDGSVEAMVQGPAGTVQALVDWAHRSPPRARVTSVDTTEAAPVGVSGFEQRPTV